VVNKRTPLTDESLEGPVRAYLKHQQQEKTMQSFMNKLRTFARRDSLMRDERGLSTVEYVIILVVVAVAAIGLWGKFGDAVKTKVSDSTKEINGMEVEKAEGQ
jgi:Flp pilus assembly pilin Flp